MSKPLGSILDGAFQFFQNGVLFDPTPLPTVIVCSKPDGSTVAPPALTHPGVGRFYAAQLFSSTDTATLEGFYSAYAATTDATVDNPGYYVLWEVEAASSSVAVSSFTGAAATQVDAIQAKTDLIASGTWSVISPTSTNVDGTVTITLTKGDDYYAANGLDIVFEVPADYAPDLTGASAVLNLPPDLDPITAYYVGNDFIKFNVPHATTQYLVKASNQFYSVVATLSDTHTVTPLIGLIVVVVGPTG